MRKITFRNVVADFYADGRGEGLITDRGWEVTTELNVAEQSTDSSAIPQAKTYHFVSCPPGHWNPEAFQRALSAIGADGKSRLPQIPRYTTNSINVQTMQLGLSTSYDIADSKVT